MNEVFNEHAQRKAEVMEYLAEVSDILSLQGNDNEAQNLQKLADYVNNDLFSIVLVGEFSSGKSTFLNALMHKRILPSFTSETTATVNFLRHAEKAPNKEAGIVYYNDGHTEALPDLNIKTIENVVSTSSNKGKETVAATINHVDLFLESDFLKNGIMLVDSPGLNGIAANHLEITRRQIEQSHAAIFMFSADHPGSKTDFEHLEELKSKSNNIFFVLNKINVINSSEQTVEDVIDDLKESYHKVFPEEAEIPKIWPVAANAALVARDKNVEEYQNGEIVKTDERRAELEQISRMEEFEIRLLQYLTQGERTRDQLLEPVHKALEQLGLLKKLLEEEQNLLNAEESPELLVKEKEKLEESLNDLEKEKKNIAAPIRIAVGKSINNLKNGISSKLEKVLNRVDTEVKYVNSVDELQEYATQLEDSLNKQYSKLARLVKEDIYNEITAVVQEKCFDYFMEISEAFDEIQGKGDMKIEKVSFEPKEFKLTAGLDLYEKEIKKLDDEIEKVEKENEQLDLERLKTQKRELELDDLKAQRKELKDRCNSILDNAYIPALQKEYIYREVYRDRNGLFGKIAQFFSGKKKDQVQELVTNEEERRRAIDERDSKIGNINEEIDGIEKKIREVGFIEVCSDAIVQTIEKNERKRERLERKILERQDALRKRIDENSEKEMRALKRQIATYAEKRSEDLEGLFKQYLDEQKKEYLDTINTLVTMNIENQLNEHHARLEKLINTINTTGEERKKKLENNQIMILKIQESMIKGVKMETELESVLKDKIEMEVLA